MFPIKRPFLHLLLPAAVTLAVWLAASAQGDQVVGSGKAVTKKFDLADFTSLDVSSTFEVTVAKAEKFSVSITADDNLLEHIKVEKKGATLSISIAKGTAVQTKSPMRAAIGMPVLKGLVASGASTVTLKDLESTEDFQARIAGASTVKGMIKAGKATIEAGGASEVKLRGSAKEGKLTAAGASKLDLADFALAEAVVNLAGASSAGVKVQSKLSYSLSGASSLTYSGDPAIGKKQLAGASSATKAP